jgi:hypothetical protein
MPKKSVSEFYKTTSRQKENRQLLSSEIMLILGTVLLAIGLPYLIPDEDFARKASLAIGLILVIFGILARKRL